MCAVRSAPADPPPIPGVRRSRVVARGVAFNVTEAGSADGLPVLCLHGWPQHHYAWRHLLASPPPGLRIIAPDLPGYGWSGPPPHRWQKEEVASDVLALLDQLGLQRVILVGHDWGGWIGWLLTLRAPERFSVYLIFNMTHIWNGPRQILPHVLPFLGYQPAIAFFGVPLQMRTSVVRIGIKRALCDKSSMTDEEINWFADRFRDPVVARAGSDTYRTFLTREVLALRRHPEQRRSVVPTRMVFGTKDVAIHPSLVAAETANAADYTVEFVDGVGHFLPDERPALVSDRLVAVAAEFPPS